MYKYVSLENYCTNALITYTSTVHIHTLVYTYTHEFTFIDIYVLIYGCKKTELTVIVPLHIYTSV